MPVCRFSRAAAASTALWRWMWTRGTLCGLRSEPCCAGLACRTHAATRYVPWRRLAETLNTTSSAQSLVSGTASTWWYTVFTQPECPAPPRGTRRASDLRRMQAAGGRRSGQGCVRRAATAGAPHGSLAHRAVWPLCTGHCDAGKSLLRQPVILVAGLHGSGWRTRGAPAPRRQAWRRPGCGRAARWTCTCAFAAAAATAAPPAQSRAPASWRCTRARRQPRCACVRVRPGCHVRLCAGANLACVGIWGKSVRPAVSRLTSLNTASLRRTTTEAAVCRRNNLATTERCTVP